MRNKKQKEEEETANKIETQIEGKRGETMELGKIAEEIEEYRDYEGKWEEDKERRKRKTRMLHREIKKYFKKKKFDS